MGLFPELDARPLDQLVQDFRTATNAGVAVPEEERALWLDEVAVALAQRGDRSLEFLTQQIRNADEERLHAILLGLSFAGKDHPGRARFCSLARSFLQHPTPEVVAASVYALGSLGCGEALKDVRPLLRHSSPYVVGSVLDFLSHQAPAEARPILVEALRSREPIVRQHAADDLDDLGAVEALPALRSLLQDADADVRQAAETAVAHLEELLAEGEKAPSP
jgi:HEAT repeat protein